MKRLLFLVPLLGCAVLLALTACSSDKDKEPEKPKRECPQTAIVRDLERVKDYGADTPDEKTLVAVALMKSLRGGCGYKDDGVDVNFELTMVAGKEARLGGNHVSFPYFIAVLDPERKILSKETLSADFTFHGSDKMAELSEPLHVFIPLEKDADASYHQVLMGFQITEDQLKDARKAAEGPLKQ